MGEPVPAAVERRFRPPSRWRDRLLTPVVPVAGGALARLPRSLLPGVAAVLAALYYGAGRRERKILDKNLERVLGLAPGSAESRTFAREVLRHQVVAALETLQIVHRPELAVLEGLGLVREVFEAAEAEGRGQLLLTAHLGSWEILEVVVPPLLRGRFLELAKPSRVAPANRYLERLRRRAGTEVIWTGGSSYLRRVVRALRRGDTVGLAADQKPEQLLGPVVSFFGRPTEFVGGPAALLRRTGCRGIFVFCTRSGPFSYRLRAARFEDRAGPSLDLDDEVAVSQVIASTIEEAIRETTEQWPWNYRRWVFEDEPWTGPRGRQRAPG